MDSNTAKKNIGNAKDGRCCISDCFTYVRRLQKASAGDPLAADVEALIGHLNAALKTFTGVEAALEARAKA